VHLPIPFVSMMRDIAKWARNFVRCAFRRLFQQPRLYMDGPRLANFLVRECRLVRYSRGTPRFVPPVSLDTFRLSCSQPLSRFRGRLPFLGGQRSGIICLGTHTFRWVCASPTHKSHNFIARGIAPTVGAHASDSRVCSWRASEITEHGSEFTHYCPD
jgi:hypothetical protein